MTQEHVLEDILQLWRTRLDDQSVLNWADNVITKQQRYLDAADVAMQGLVRAEYVLGRPLEPDYWRDDVVCTCVGVVVARAADLKDGGELCRTLHK